MQRPDAVAGRSDWMQWSDAATGCSGRTKGLDAVAGRRGWMQWPDVAVGRYPSSTLLVTHIETTVSFLIQNATSTNTFNHVVRPPRYV